MDNVAKIKITNKLKIEFNSVLLYYFEYYSLLSKFSKYWKKI